VDSPLEGTGFELLVPGGDRPGFPTPSEEGRRSGEGHPATFPAFLPFHAEIRRFGWEHCPRTFGRIIEFEPSIVVLPFTNMSGDHEKEDFFADGMLDEIIPCRPYPLAPVSGPPTSRVG